jgi:hypothetical protein
VREPARSDEARLAVRTAGLLLVLAVGAVAVAAPTLGTGAALSALVGVGLTAVLWGVSAALLVWAAGRGRDHALEILVGGAAVRLGFYLVVLDALSRLAWVHRPSLAVATAASLAVTLVAEMVWMTRLPRLFWVDAEAARPSVVSHATRS